MKIVWDKLRPSASRCSVDTGDGGDEVPDDNEMEHQERSDMEVDRHLHAGERKRALAPRAMNANDRRWITGWRRHRSGC